MPDLYQHIRFRVEERVARVTFARPPLNIFTIAMMREVDAALTECMGMRDVVAVVFDAVAGSRAFSAGVSVEEHQPETVYQMLESFHNVFRTLDQMSKPALAVVEGAALGGGCELVAGCDIVIAASGAKFGQPEIKLGVFPPVAAVLLPRIMGERRAHGGPQRRGAGRGHPRLRGGAGRPAVAHLHARALLGPARERRPPLPRPARGVHGKVMSDE